MLNLMGNPNNNQTNNITNTNENILIDINSIAFNFGLK